MMYKGFRIYYIISKALTSVNNYYDLNVSCNDHKLRDQNFKKDFPLIKLL